MATSRHTADADTTTSPGGWPRSASRSAAAAASAHPGAGELTAARPAPESRVPEIDRLIFFSDAVFAIALMLLVIRIEVPAGPDRAHLVLAQWPKYLSYLISFAAVGLCWMGHHRTFRYIECWDERLIALNLLLLLFIAFIPFPAAMIGEHGGYRISLIFYAATLGLAGLASLLIWAYATYDRRLVGTDLDEAVIRRHWHRGMVAPLVFFVSIPLSLVSMDAAYYSWLLIAVALLVLRGLGRKNARARRDHEERAVR
jgi:uncharacterized membrane protein